MKEEFEWIKSLCNHTDKNDLPRVLLVGDSITEGYQAKVNEKLMGKCYVDYVAASYSIDGDVYNNLILSFVNDSKYDIIHFNYGLHAIHVPEEIYKDRLKKILKNMPKNCKIILALTTCVFKCGNEVVDGFYKELVEKRNDVMLEIAEKNGYVVDDLYSVSKSIVLTDRNPDGTHYLDNGNEILAKVVANKIKEVLNG